MPITIRIATLADVPALVELNRTVQTLHVGRRPDRFKDGDAVAVADWFTSKLSSATCRVWIAEAGGEVVGYILAISTLRAESAFTHARQFVEIDQIAVLPSHRRGGVARRLVDIAGEDARVRGLGDLELSSWQFNAEAHAAFRALGFEAQVTRFSRPSSWRVPTNPRWCPARISIPAESACPFCKLDDPTVTVFADGVLQALVSHAPINEYHVIIVPRRHVERLVDVPLQTLTAVLACAQRISAAIVGAAQPDGFTYITEDDLTGQGYNLVAHWKLHVIARFQNDAVRLDWGRLEDPGAARRAVVAESIRSRLIVT